VKLMANLYAPSRTVTELRECYFYHTMDLQGVGHVRGNWNLRNIAAYLGNSSFKGKRALDVGCASGALSFFMEQQGAEVVSFDLDKTGDWDMVPFAKWEHFDHISRERKQIIDRLNNSYWFAHRHIGSRAKVVYGSVYDIPLEIGTVDVTVYGSILLHLRDPFLALQNGLKLTKDTVIVAETLRGQPVPTTEPYLGFLPDARTVEPKDAWWDLRPEWVVRALGVLGFENARVSYHSQDYEGQDTQLYTVVARRTHGIPVSEVG
jgi:hypothetical protein